MKFSLGEDIQQIPTNISNTDRYYDLTDTLICSYLRLEELEYLMSTKQLYERSAVVANCAMPEDIIYYVNSHGYVTKFRIKE
jgi:hypothetical protein